MIRLGESGPEEGKRVGFRGVIRLGESGPGDAKATEKPRCRESCKEKK